LAALALGGAAKLLTGLIEGSFESLRYFGTLAVADRPAGFVVAAALLLLGTVLLAFFARQALRDVK
jgi:hypothetical protein